MRASISSTFLAGIVLLATAGPAFCAEAKIQAEREKSGTSCDWSLDPHNPKEPKVRLVSYLPTPLFHAERAGVVAKFGESGVMLNQFSFQVHFTPQNRPNVRPGVNVRYLNDKNQSDILRLPWSDFQSGSSPGDRELRTYNFVSTQGHALRVQSIAIGGNEMTYRTGGSTFPVDKTAPMDISVAGFKAIDASGQPVTTNYNLDVLEFAKHANSSLNGLPCVVNR